MTLEESSITIAAPRLGRRDPHELLSKQLIRLRKEKRTKDRARLAKVFRFEGEVVR